MRVQFLLSISFLFVLVGSPIYSQTSHRAAVSAARNYPRLPLAFEKHAENTGISNEVFIARGQGYSIGLEMGTARIGLIERRGDPGRLVSLEFAGAKKVFAETGEALPGKVNYLRGGDPRRWQLGVPTYSRISYSGIYPGIDVVYYGNQEQLEFDLVVKPGGNPQDIRMKIDGGSTLSIGRTGELRIGGPGGALSIALPTIYQQIGGKRVAVPGRYAIRGRDEVAFLVSRYDHREPLVIDPTIVYSTLLNGGNNSSVGYGIALDGSGNMLVAGYTYASDFPTSNSLQSGLKSGPDAFVSKISADGTTLLYSTYVGGSNFDYFQGIAVDSKGAAWVVGSSYSSDFPLLNPLQTTNGGGSDVVMAKFSASGALLFSTYLGSTNFDTGNGVAVDSSDNAYVTGSTNGGTFPTSAGALLTSSGGNTDAFVVKVDSTGKRIYSTLLGGSSDDFGQGIGADVDGNAYVTGYTYSNSFVGAPSTGAQVSNAGIVNAFVAKLNSAGTALQYFTFLGGTGYDQGLGIAVDGSKNAYVVGQTSSSGIATTGAAQTSIANGSHGFAAKLNPAGSTFNYITYIGGNRQDYLNAVAVDAGGNLYLGGSTDSTAFPIGSAVQPTANGNVVSVSRTTNSASAWAAFDTLLPGAVYDISLNAANGTIVASTEAGLYRSVDGGASWKSVFAQGFSSANYLARSISAPETIYVANYNNIYRSKDDGVTWSYVGNSPYQASGIMADPLTANTAYIFSTTSSNIYKSTDGGATWTLASTGLPFSGASRPQTMVATKDGSLYVGLSSFGGIYKSTNQGGSWTAANGSLDSLTVNSHSLSASGNTLYFAAGALYKTTDGGTSWTATSTIANAGSVAVSPLDATSLYVGTYSNTILGSGDGGGTFGNAGAGLPTTFDYRSSEIVVHPTSGATAYVLNPIVKPAFVLKLNSDGSAFLWFTYLGGSANSFVYGMATNRAGEVFATGYSGGGSFPVTATHLQSGTYGAFVTRISDATAVCSTLSLSPGSSTLSSSSGSVSFNVLAPSGCAWSASSDQAWATISDGASGTGSGLITVKVSSNVSGATRVATLTAGTQTATLSQADASCVFALDKSSYPLPSAGGSISAVLNVGPACPWIVTNNYGIVTIVSGASGSGPGSIGLSVPANVGSAGRTFNLAVGNTVINIVQATSAVTITTTSLPLGSPGTAYSAQLNARGGTGPYSSWQVASGTLPPGLTLDSASGIISGNPTTVSANPTQFSVTVADSLGTVSNVAPLSISVLGAIPRWGITVSHIGNFAQSQLAAEYKAVVANTGSAPTSGTVLASIAVPAGLTVASIAGTGWACGIASCSRSDALQAGASYPVLTLTVNVAAGATSPLGTQIGVSGGAASDASATDQTTVVGALTDIVPSDFFFTAVNLLREYGITGGCSASPPQYCPNDNVTRAQMAIFIVRTIAGGDNFTFSSTPYFTDVAATDFGFKWIQKMYELGITAGCGSGKYCPLDFVTRGQMAIFVIRARLGAASDNTFSYPATPSFDDVPTSAPFFKWIQRMKVDQITTGCTATSYCSDSAVTRAQMAIFLMRGGFNRLLPTGTAVVASVSPAVATAGGTVTLTVIGANTHFQQGTTQVSAGPGMTVNSVSVIDASTLTAQVAVASNANAGNRTIVVITGSEEAILPNGLAIQ